MKIFGNSDWYQGAVKKANINSDGSIVSAGSNRYIMGTHQSASRTSTGAFINYTEQFGTPACAQFNKTSGLYTCPETGFYLLTYTLSLGAEVPGRSIVGLSINGTHRWEVIDITGMQYADIGGSLKLYLNANDTLSLTLNYFSITVTCRVYMCCMMVGS